jgi:hypothetical protein
MSVTVYIRSDNHPLEKSWFWAAVQLGSIRIRAYSIFGTEKNEPYKRKGKNDPPGCQFRGRMGYRFLCAS